MCMSRKRMTQRRANFEIFLLVMRFVRSIFFNLFMLGLGFFLGAGFCMSVIKARSHLFHTYNFEISKKINRNSETCPSNLVKTVVTSGDSDGKSDF